MRNTGEDLRGKQIITIAHTQASLRNTHGSVEHLTNSLHPVCLPGALLQYATKFKKSSVIARKGYFSKYGQSETWFMEYYLNTHTYQDSNENSCLHTWWGICIEFCWGKKKEKYWLCFFCDAMFIYLPHTCTAIEFSELKFWSDTLSDHRK